MKISKILISGTKCNLLADGSSVSSIKSMYTSGALMQNLLESLLNKKQAIILLFPFIIAPILTMLFPFAFTATVKEFTIYKKVLLVKMAFYGLPALSLGWIAFDTLRKKEDKLTNVVLLFLFSSALFMYFMLNFSKSLQDYFGKPIFIQTKLLLKQNTLHNTFAFTFDFNGKNKSFAVEKEQYEAIPETLLTHEYNNYQLKFSFLPNTLMIVGPMEIIFPQGKSGIY